MLPGNSNVQPPLRTRGDGTDRWHLILLFPAMLLIRQKEGTERTYPGLSVAEKNRTLAPLNPVGPEWEGRLVPPPPCCYPWLVGCQTLRTASHPSEHSPRWYKMFTGTCCFYILLTTSSAPHSRGKVTPGPCVCSLFSAESVDGISCLWHHFRTQAVGLTSLSLFCSTKSDSCTWSASTATNRATEGKG